MPNLAGTYQCLSTLLSSNVVPVAAESMLNVACATLYLSNVYSFNVFVHEQTNLDHLLTFFDRYANFPVITSFSLML